MYVLWARGLLTKMVCTHTCVLRGVRACLAEAGSGCCGQGSLARFSAGSKTKPSQDELEELFKPEPMPGKGKGKGKGGKGKQNKGGIQTLLALKGKGSLMMKGKWGPPPNRVTGKSVPPTEPTDLYKGKGKGRGRGRGYPPPKAHEEEDQEEKETEEEKEEETEEEEEEDKEGRKEGVNEEEKEEDEEQDDKEATSNQKQKDRKTGGKHKREADAPQFVC